MTKRILSAFLALVLAAALLSGCGSGAQSLLPQDTADTTAPQDGGAEGEPVRIDEPESGDLFRRFGYDVVWLGIDARGVVSSAEGDFCTLVDFPYSTRWKDDDGLYIYTDDEGSIPYVLIYRNANRNIDPDKYLTDQYLPEMRRQYGSDFVSASAVKTVQIGGKDVHYVEILYDLPDAGVRISARRCCCQYGSSFLIFTSKVIDGEGDEETLGVLEDVIWNYKDGADYTFDTWDYYGPVSPSPGGTQTSVTGFGAYTRTVYEKLTLETTTVSNEIFSMEVPAGWVLTTHKAYTDFGVYLYDPQVPERKIFFYCKLDYFNKSQAAKNWYQQMASYVTGPDVEGWHVSAAVPVLDPPTTANFYTIYDEFINLLYQINGTAYIYPDLHQVSILESWLDSAQTAPTCTDHSIVRATFVSDNGVECQGLMSGQVTDTLTIYQNGIDVGMRTVYDVMGVTAPAAEFPELEEVLLRCLASFDFTEEYVRQTMQHTAEQTEQILAQARSMQAVYDAYNDAWSRRQTAYDILSQKRSDATLGYERLYDPDTGEVYRAELGFWDAYDTHRNEYENSRLRLVDSSTEQYYLQTVSYYITR